MRETLILAFDAKCTLVYNTNKEINPCHLQYWDDQVMWFQHSLHLSMMDAQPLEITTTHFPPSNICNNKHEILFLFASRTLISQSPYTAFGIWMTLGLKIALNLVLQHHPTLGSGLDEDLLCAISWKSKF